MKLILLMQGHTAEDHPGIHDAFEKLLCEGELTGYDVIPYYGHAQQYGWKRLCEDTLKKVRESEADVVLFHHFHGTRIPSPTHLFHALRDTPSKPTLIVTCGDPYSGDWLMPHYPRSFTIASKLADMTFLTSMGRCAKALARQGSKNIVLLPLGFCQKRFSPTASQTMNIDFDVVFVGSLIRSRNILSHYHYAARNRRNCVDLLQRRYGKRLGLFGHGWHGYPSWQGPIPFSQQADAGKRSRIVFGGYPHSLETYYASNRPFICSTSGTPLVDWYVPRVDRLLRNGDHWHLVRDEKGLTKTIDTLLAQDFDDLRERGKNTATYTLSKHSQYSRIRFLTRTVRAFRNAKAKGHPASPPPFDFFLPEVRLKDEHEFSLHNWDSG